MIFETTGRVDYANCGIIGISDGCLLFGGYDDGFSDADSLTPEERNELADFMVAQWEQFRSGVEPEQPPGP